MAQIVFRGNLSIASFPFVSSFGGRSIVVPQLDENYLPKSINSVTNDFDHDRGIPQLAYCHNVMPVGQGFKSIGYTKCVNYVLPARADIIESQVVRDSSNNKAILEFASNGDIYMMKAGDSTMILIAAVVGWTGATPITFATVNGNTYVCLQGLGIYKVNITGRTLDAFATTGIVQANLIGIADSNNYLIAYTSTVVAWSSATDPSDFVPSLVTGAGSGTPNDLAGTIVIVLGLSNGFAVYSTKNIILASFSGNTQYPWVFRSAVFGSGINYLDQVTSEDDLAYHYAYTTAGLVKVTTNGCEVVEPELTDFLSGKVFEDYNTATKKFTVTYISSQLSVRLAFIGGRFLVVSYGIVDGQYTHAVVWDEAFNRWGKLKIDHIKCFDMSVSPNGDPLTWTELNTDIWAMYATLPWTLMSRMNNDAAATKFNLGFLQNDGSMYTADFSFGQAGSEGVMLLGKYQINRNNFCTLHEIEVEGVDAFSLPFNVFVLSTIDGSTFQDATTPTKTLAQGNVRKYNSFVSGANHTVVMQGSFHIVTLVLTMTNDGRM